MEGFNCTNSLWMIWATLMTLDHKLSSESFHHGTDKVETLITSYTYGVTRLVMIGSKIKRVAMSIEISLVGVASSHQVR
jgi:hypothetical protein